MFPNCRFSVAAATLSLVAVLFAAPAARAQAQTPAAKCEDAGVAVLASPNAPWKGAPLRVIFTVENALDGELSLVAPNGKVAVASRERHGGPPYFWFAEVASPAAGTWQAKLTRDGATGACATVTRPIEVRRAATAPPRQTNASVWPVRAAWDRSMENIYSAWIEKLFDAPLEEAPSWKALHDVLRDRQRNALFNHLGLGEDQKGLVIRPDCADLPYFLRAYFAFKMGLPYGYAKCTRGGGGKPPQCPVWWNIANEEPPPEPPAPKTPPPADFFGLFTGSTSAKSQPQSKVSLRPPGLVPSFGYYLRNTVANGVHSGSGRTAADDDRSDYYSVPLKAENLRPGTVYADPYGHLLVIAKRVPQTADGAGVILAVDGQPDGTIARKRFWRGNFLFAQDPALGSPGFKRFRPVVASRGGGLRRLTNAEIAKNPDYADFSLEQSQLGVEDFYDRMDDLMSPDPLDPLRAIREAITALDEQVRARVTSVENGRQYQVKGGAEVSMPDGASIFETTGAWEDFATPSRDLRLLIAIDVVRGFPERVARRPERYAMPKDKTAADVKAELESVLASELAARKFEYARTDGSAWSLTLKDVVERAADLEMAYNINDCVELRWGASPDSEEAKTCKKQASGAQRQKMSEYRSWFNERRRPPRG
ncbi:MAG TPA: hypothetical protein VNR88_04015 [Hyphomicrobium sp.]|nr:hypothetical protein [Hyphomicrobium sp.]